MSKMLKFLDVMGRVLTGELTCSWTGLVRLGHMQTVQTQYRHCKMQHMMRVYTVCLQEFLCKVQSK